MSQQHVQVKQATEGHTSSLEALSYNYRLRETTSVKCFSCLKQQQRPSSDTSSAIIDYLVSSLSTVSYPLPGHWGVRGGRRAGSRAGILLIVGYRFGPFVKRQNMRSLQRAADWVSESVSVDVSASHLGRVTDFFSLISVET